MATWYIFTYGVFSPMQPWEHESFNEAAAQNRNIVEYVWPSQGHEPADETEITRYEVNMLAMTQTNMSTMTVRRMLYLPDDTAHAVTSPFQAGLRARSPSATR